MSTKPTSNAAPVHPEGYVPRSRVFRAIRAAEHRFSMRKSTQMKLAAFIIERGYNMERDGEEDPDFADLLDALQRVIDKHRFRAFALEYYVTEVLGQSKAEMERFVKRADRAMRRQAKGT